MLERIVSGGQTGVDRAALDAAMDLGFEVGGWCPKDRRAVDGSIPAKYPLTETRSKAYRVRTRWNVRDSDATLIVCRDLPTGGTALTIEFCEHLDKPFKVHQLGPDDPFMLDGPDSYPMALLYWLNSQQVRVLNVAGPRENEPRPIYSQSYSLLHELLKLTKQA